MGIEPETFCMKEILAQHYTTADQQPYTWAEIAENHFFCPLQNFLCTFPDRAIHHRKEREKLYKCAKFQPKRSNPVREPIKMSQCNIVPF